MTTMHIALPEDPENFVHNHLRGRHSTASEFSHELIRRVRKEAASEQLEQLLLDDIGSGEPIEVTPEFWEDRRAELERHLRKRRGD